MAVAATEVEDTGEAMAVAAVDKPVTLVEGTVTCLVTAPKAKSAITV